MLFTRRRGLVIIIALGLGTWMALFAAEQRLREPANFTLIEKGLYLGGHVDAPPPGTKTVLNLCEFENAYKCEHQRWAKIPDSSPAPSLDWILKQVKFVAEQRKEGRTTYVHCFAGISRSAMVVTAYLMLEHDWTRDEALEFLRKRRPQVRPNPAFMTLLAEWERSLKKAADRDRNP